MWSKWRKYSARYGYVHAAVRFAGSKAPIVWHTLGPSVSIKYRESWLNSPGHKVINLGGGGHVSEDFLTVDIDPRADSYVDLTKRLPFKDGSIDAVFCEEAIEHIDKIQGFAMLVECARILKPGGAIRIITPDLDWFSARLLDGSIECDAINKIFFDHGHKYIYSRHELSNALTEAGFVFIRNSSYKDPKSKLGFLDSHPQRFNHPPEISQYVDAQRPESRLNCLSSTTLAQRYEVDPSLKSP